MRELAIALKSNIRMQILAVCAFSALTAVCSQVSFHLWFTPVPVTLQVFAMLLSGLALGGRLGALSQIQYVCLGLMGFPVFAGFTGGPVALAGPSGGYLMGFIAGAYAAGWIFERLRNRPGSAWLASIAGIAVLYLLGASWLGIWVASAGSQSLSEVIRSAWVMGVVPFVGVDLVKAAAAGTLVQRIR